MNGMITITNRNYNAVVIDNALPLNAYTPAHFAGIQVLYDGGKFYTKRGDILTAIRFENVTFELNSLSREKLQKLIDNNTPMKLSKNDKQEYTLDFFKKQ